MSDYLCEWQPTEHDNRLYELAARYHTECEAYDRTVCTGPIRHNEIQPANIKELVLINRHALAVLKRLTEQAAHEGISAEELAREIGKWHGSLPNAGRHGRI